MIDMTRGVRAITRHGVMTVGVTVWAATGALGVQAPHAVPPTHERQCVATGDIPPGDARTITVTWKQPFATGAYSIIGSVAESGESRRAIELEHFVIPYTPTTAAAVVSNRDVSAAQSGVLCLDATTE